MRKLLIVLALASFSVAAVGSIGCKSTKSSGCSTCGH